MKILLVSFLLLLSQVTVAATSKKKVVKKKATIDKVYKIENTSPEIIIGEREKLSEKNKNIYTRPADLWSVALVRSGLKYQLSSITANSLSFSPILVGLIIGKKIEDQFFLYKGYYEISGEWQRFKRESTIGTNVLYSQKLDLYQIDIFQNINLAWALSHSVFFSVGIGFAPVYLTTEQSVLGNSTSELGYMGMLKGNIVIPLNKRIMKNYEMDIALKTGWGSVGSHEISTTALSLGLNFE
ncbi:MAG: hypothetical protein PHY93_08465 [Bacteriovorax sp.]|nr:hypothetical protein [Bacteriovorax sp.]